MVINVMKFMDNPHFLQQTLLSNMFDDTLSE